MSTKNKKNKNQLGFTLLELLVVMAIIGLLAALGLASFIGNQAKARDATRKRDLANMTSALEAYYNDHGCYPYSEDGVIRGCGGDPCSSSATICNWGSPWIFVDGGREITYATKLALDPADPTGTDVRYQYASDGRSYWLFSTLENEKDKGVGVARTADGQLGAYQQTDDSGLEIKCHADSESKCSYGVSSTNTTIEAKFEVD